LDRSVAFTGKIITVDFVGNGMSQPDTDTGGSESPVAERLLRQDEFAADLNAQGYTDILVVRRESGRDILTDSRLELIEQLDQHGSTVDSVSDLARQLDRDKGAVSKDLNRLAELDVVEYEGSGDGTAKRPRLKHDHIVIEPVVY
jgi:DNA-binding MarR family transcriptional regulator